MQLTRSNVNSEFLLIRDKLSSYLYRLTTNREDTEDLIQDTFLKVNNKIHLFKGKSSFKTWVFSIATNLAVDNKRVKQRWRLDIQDDCKTAAQENKVYHDRIVNAFECQTEKVFEIEEHINFCFTCIAKNLKLEKQIALILKEIYHFKRNEIAEILGKTEGIVKHLLFDGRKEMQEKYNYRCAIINKNGICYQCAELNDYLQNKSDAEEKITKLGMSPANDPEQNLDIRFKLIQNINPIGGKAGVLEDTIMQILHEVNKNQ